MFLESDFYTKHKKELEEAIKEIDYTGDPLQFVTDFQLCFYECKMRLDNKSYFDILKNLGNNEEYVSDFLLSYQYFLKTISRIILNINYNMHILTINRLKPLNLMVRHMNQTKYCLQQLLHLLLR